MTEIRIKQEFNTEAVCRVLLGAFIAFTVPGVAVLAQDTKQPDLRGLSSQKCENLFSGKTLIAPEEKKAIPNAIPNNASVFSHPIQRESSSSSVSEIYSLINAKAKQEGEFLLGRNLTEREAQALVNLTSPIWKHRAAYLELLERESDIISLSDTQTEKSQSKPHTLTEDQSWMLKQAGFSREEIEQILSVENGLTGDQSWMLKQAGFSEREIEQMVSVENGMSLFLPDLEAPQMALAKKIQEGEPFSLGEKPLIFVRGLENYVARVTKIDGPGKIIIEFPNPETGDLNTITLNDITVSETREGRENIHERVKNWEESQVDVDSARAEKLLQESSVSASIAAYVSAYQAVRPEELFQKVSAEAKIFSKKYGMIKTFDLATGQIFAAYLSDRKILSLEELNLQMEISVDPDSSNIGESIHYEIREQIAFARAIRRLAKPPHPHNTHIEYLALKIPSRIPDFRILESGIQ